MEDRIHKILSQQPAVASAPCRVDLGGTLDISSFYLPLRYLHPATFNIAIDMRTTVSIHPHAPGRIRITSRGFESADFPLDAVPFNHPMGLMFAVAAYFRIDGIHIRIESASPPKSALGGSSVAAVALIGAFSSLLSKAGDDSIDTDRIPILAYNIEQSVAGVPCGFQDQLAAAYGGINAWYWTGDGGAEIFQKKPVLDPHEFDWLNARMLVAYCGIPHESKDVNGIWVRQFMEGTHRKDWVEIAELTKAFVHALSEKNVSSAISPMNRETSIRREMTPHVVDDMGSELIASAMENGCGARFTGAGGGGCIWALGDPGPIAALKEEVWPRLLGARKDAAIFDASIDDRGLEVL